MPDDIQLSPEQIAAAKPVDDIQLTPEQIASAQPVEEGVSPLHTFSAEQLVQLQKQDPEQFDLVNSFLSDPTAQKDPAIRQKAEDAYHLMRQEAWYKDLPTPIQVLKNVGSIGKGFAKQAINYASAAASAPALAIATAQGVDEEPRLEVARDIQRRIAENWAGTETGITGLLSQVEKAVGGLGRVLHINKSLKDYTPEDKAEAFDSALGHAQTIQAAMAGQGPFMKATGATQGVEIRPEEVSQLAAGDPFSWEAMGGLMGGAGKLTRAAVSEAARAAVQNIAQTAVKKAVGLPLQAAAGTAEFAGKGLEKAAPIVGPIGAVGAAMAHQGAGGLIAALYALEKGTKAAQKAGVGIAKTGASVGRIAKEVTGEGPTTGGYAQLGRDVLESVPGAAGELAKGAAFDLGIAATSDTPQEKQGVGLGTAFGILGAGRGVAQKVISGQIIAPREFQGSQVLAAGSGATPALESMTRNAFPTLTPGQRVRFNATRTMLASLNPDADIFVGKNPEEIKAALMQAGMGEATADSFAQQGGATFDLNGRRVAVLNADSLVSAPHEARHAIENVLGEGTLRQLDEEVQRRYGAVFDSIGQDYTNRVAGKNVGENWRDALLELTGQGARDAAEKLFNQYANEAAQQGKPAPTVAELQQRLAADGATDWRSILTPEEQADSANRYLSREIEAENFDSWFKHMGGNLEAKQQVPEVLANWAATLMQTFGSEPLAGRVSETLKIPLSREIAARTGEQAQGLRPEIAPAVVPPAKSLTTPGLPRTPQEQQQAAQDAAELAKQAPDAPVAGGTKSQREILGVMAEAIANRSGVKLNYLSAPEEPAAAISSKRSTRRAMIEAFRTMPQAARRLWEKTFFPEKVLKTKAGKYQVAGWAPEVFAANAHKLAGLMADTPTLAALSPYEVDAATKSFTAQAWQDLYEDVTKFVANQQAGKTGAGAPLQVPEEIQSKGFFRPQQKGGAKPLDQRKADFINMLFNFKLPDTARMQRGKLPLNIAGQEVSEATQPGRLVQPSEPRPAYTGEAAQELGIEGRPILEVNPVRNEFENAAKAAGKSMPSFIEAIQNLNLENMKEAEHAPEVPEFRGNTLTLSAGFAPRARAEEERKAAPVWYSQAQRVLDAKMPNAATGEQVAAILRNPQNGIKADELKWSGLDDFLKGKQRVTKQEVQDYLKQNAVQVKEVTKGADFAPELPENLKKAGFAVSTSRSASEGYNLRYRGRLLESSGDAPREYQDDVQEFFENANRPATENQTKFENYQLPGGENYRELLFQLPRNSDVQRLDELNQKVMRGGMTEAERNEYKALRARGVTVSDTFKSSHWDEPNVLAHVRFNDRTDAEGNKVKFIEEIQSDWHQKGRKEGYAQPEFKSEDLKLKDHHPVAGGLGETWTYDLPTGERIGSFLAHSEAEARAKALTRVQTEDLGLKKSPGVPDAPFKNSWHEMVFRRMVRMAAEEGADKIAWTTGEQQAERYDLSKQVSEIGAVKNSDGTYGVNARTARGTQTIGTDISAGKLADYVGKDLAEKIVNGRGSREVGEPENFQRFSGTDLKVGGEGMKGFYDKILVDYANKFGKRFGAKVEKIEVPSIKTTKGERYGVSVSETPSGRWVVEDNLGTKHYFDSERQARAEMAPPKPETVHSLSITPEMKKSAIEQGMPQFAPRTKTDVELTAPDGKKYKAWFDGHMDWSAIGRGKIPQFTLQEDVPGVGIKHSTFMGPTVDKAGYTYSLPADGQFAPRAEDVTRVADEYAKGAGITLRPSAPAVPVNETAARNLADFYELAPHEPASPQVKSSYDALARETVAQYKAITDAGYTLEPWTGQGEPYPNSSAMVADVRDNKHLYFLPTGNAFTSESNNLMLRPSGVEGMPVNDVFRAVHDFFGHAKEGHQFGPKGEYNAWREHSQMYSSDAQGALAAETLAQNSWVNFGRHLRTGEGETIPQKGEAGYVAPTERPFAEQKNVVIPEDIRAKFAPRAEPSEEAKQSDKKTFIVRHGSTEMNSSDPAKDLIRGHIDIPLDAKGRKEAQETAQQIADAGGVQHIIASDLGRTQETAKTIADKTGASVELDPGLRPWNFGPTIEGHPTKEMLPKIRELTENPDTRPPGGETFNEFKDRFLSAFKRAQEANTDRDTALVTHYRGTKLLDAWRATGVDNDTIDKAIFEEYDKAKKPGSVDVVDKTGTAISGKEAVSPKGEKEKIADLKRDANDDVARKWANEAAAQFAARQPVTGGRKSKQDYQLKEGPGLYSKAWILPDGKPVQLGGQFHHDWLNENADLIKRYGLKVSNAEPENRIEALQKGFARVNYEKNTGTLTVEARLQDWQKLGPSVKRLAEANIGKIDNMDVHLLDPKAGKTLESEGVALHSYDAGEKLDHLPFITEPTSTVTLSPQARAEQAGLESGQFAPSNDPRAIKAAAVQDPETGEHWEGPMHFYATQAATDATGRNDAEFLTRLKEGFTTNTPGEFLTRSQALERAVELNQLREAQNAEQQKMLDTFKKMRTVVSEQINIPLESWMGVKQAGGRFAPRFEAPALDAELDKIRSGESIGQTFNPDGTVWTPENKKVDVVTLASVNLPLGQLTRDALEKAAAPYEDLLDEPNVKLGAFSFSHQGTPTVSVDINAIVPQKYRDNSVKFAKDNDQVAIFDVAKNDVVETGGKGNTKLRSVGELSDAIEGLSSGKPVDVDEIIRQNREAGPQEEQGVFAGLGTKSPLGGSTMGNMTKAEIAAHYPESVIPKRRNEKIASDIVGSPLYKEAGSEPAAVKSFAQKLVDFAKEYQSNPVFQAGLKWYSDFVPRLKEMFGKHAPMMAELLAATSPRNNPTVNYAYALDALEGFKAGRYDKQVTKFIEGVEKLKDDSWRAWFDKELKADRVIDPPAGEPTPEAFMAHWIDKFGLRPRQSNGQLFGANSVAVLKVLAGEWLKSVEGPKVSNFVQNLLGTGHGATIDVWANRTMRRVGYAGYKDRWRILPKNEAAVSDADFAFAQKAFAEAGKQLGVKADALQGALWFAEKALYADRGYARLDLGSYQTEMDKTAMLKKGIAQRLAATQKVAKAKRVEQPSLL